MITKFRNSALTNPQLEPNPMRSGRVADWQPGATEAPRQSKQLIQFLFGLVLSLSKFVEPKVNQPTVLLSSSRRFASHSWPQSPPFCEF